MKSKIDKPEQSIFYGVRRISFDKHAKLIFNGVCRSKTPGIKNITWITIAGLGILLTVILNSCMESRKVTAKSGAQLWAENCQRCHNTPSPSSFSHEQWVTIGMHMQTRAQLTEMERDKIVSFLTQ